MSQYVSHEAAAEALDSLDDYARMGTGVDAYGPRGMLERYIAQQAATLRQQAARVDEVCEGCGGHGEVGGLTPQGYDSQECPFCHGTGKEAALSAQPAPERQGEAFPMTEQQVRQWMKACNSESARQVLRDYLRLRAHPAAPVGVPDDAWPRLELWFFRELSDAQRLSLLKLHGFPVDEIGESLILQKRSLRRILAAAPSAPQGTQQGEG